MPETVTLTDPATGDSARIRPDLGFNCFSFVRMLRGRPVEVLWSHPNFQSGDERPSGSGIPILFPFAGRIQGTVLHYEEREYPLEPGDQFGNAIHGFVLNRPWRVIERTATRCVGQFRASVDDGTLLLRWPADFSLSVSYELKGGALLSELRVENPGGVPLPFGLATHAYFRLPPGGQGSAAASIVTVPVKEQWELADLRPTGRLVPLGQFSDLPKGMTLGDKAIDCAFTGLASRGGRCQTTIQGGSGGAKLTQTFDDSFRHVVIYTPPHREAMCIEPYTAIPDPFRLEQSGVATGLRRLPPGETFTARVEIRLEQA